MSSCSINQSLKNEKVLKIYNEAFNDIKFGFHYTASVCMNHSPETADTHPTVELALPSLACYGTYSTYRGLGIWTYPKRKQLQK